MSSKRAVSLQGSHVQSEPLRSPCIRDIQADRVLAAHVRCQRRQASQRTAHVRRWTGTQQFLGFPAAPPARLPGSAPAKFRDLLGLLHGTPRGSRPQTHYSRPACPWVGRTRAGTTTAPPRGEAGAARSTGPLGDRPGVEPLWRFPFLMEEAMMICRTENLFRHLHHLFRISHHTRQDPGSAGIPLPKKNIKCPHGDPIGLQKMQQTSMVVEPFGCAAAAAAMLAAFLLPATLFRELPVLLVIPYGDQKCKNNA